MWKPRLLDFVTMTISESQRKYLRGLGHRLNPVVMIGDAGLTDAVLAETESSLSHHELIKVRVKVGDRKLRDSIIAELGDRSSAEIVQRVGNMALLYRENPDGRKIKLP